MNTLRSAVLLAAFAATAASAQTFAAQAFAQPSTAPGRQTGPTRQADTKVPQPGERDKIFPLGTSWVAVSLNGKPFSGDRPSFRLDDQLRASGFGGCNTYSATAYPLRDQGLAVGPFALTKRSCDKAAMAIEQAFLVALRTSAKWDTNGPYLTIRSQNGELRFERGL